MKRIAKIKNGVCVQVFEEPDTFTPDASNGQVDITGIHVGPGWLYDGSSWTDPDAGKVVAAHPKPAGATAMVKSSSHSS